MYLYHNHKEFEFNLTQAQYYIQHNAQPSTKPSTISLPAMHQHINHPTQPRLIRGEFLVSPHKLDSVELAMGTIMSLKKVRMPQKNNKLQHRYISMTKDGRYRVSYKGMHKIAPSIEGAKQILQTLIDTHSMLKEQIHPIAKASIIAKELGDRTAIALHKPIVKEPLYLHTIEENTYIYKGVIIKKVPVMVDNETTYTYTFSEPIVKRPASRQAGTQYYVGMYSNRDYVPVALLILMVETGCSDLAKYRFVDGDRENYHRSNLELIGDSGKPKSMQGVNILGRTVSRKELTIKIFEYLHSQKGTYQLIYKSKISCALMVNHKCPVFREALKAVPQESWFRIHKNYIEILA